MDITALLAARLSPQTCVAARSVSRRWHAAFTDLAFGPVAPWARACGAGAGAGAGAGRRCTCGRGWRWRGFEGFFYLCT